jgi:hypothetical protein
MTGDHTLDRDPTYSDAIRKIQSGSSLNGIKAMDR